MQNIPTSLSTFLFQEGISPALRHIILKVAKSSKYVSHAIHTGDLGKAGTSNLYGEQQLTLDVLADEIFCENISQCEGIAMFASEEKDEAVPIFSNGEFVIAFDPLDGSSLVDVNLAVGSIFGIWKGQDFLGKTGEDMVSAGFFVYGPRTTFLLSIGNGVHEFTLNDLGEYHISKENLCITPETKMFSPGNLRATIEKISYKKVLDRWVLSGKTLRYSGGMVPDVNAIFLKGNGIFTYPSHSAYPNGKLRLMYECAPMAFLVSQAGGIAKNEKGESILSLPCENIHQRTPIFLGSENEVNTVLEILNENLEA